MRAPLTKLTKLYEAITQPEDDVNIFGPHSKPVPIDSFESTNIPISNYKRLHALLEDGFGIDPVSKKAKPPLFIFGAAGIGKSTIVKKFAESCAQRQGKNLVEITSVTDEEIKKICSDPLLLRDTFVFIDLRADEILPDTIGGVPDMEKGHQVGHVVYQLPPFVRWITTPGAHGLVILDEYNRAKEDILAMMMKFTLDRQVAQRNISPGIQIVAAGNIGASYSVQTLDPAQQSRFKATVFVISPEEWADVARQIGVNDWIIDYATKNNGEHLFGRVDTSTSNAESEIPVTPRSVTQASFAMNRVLRAYRDYINNNKPLPEGFSGNPYDDIQHLALAGHVGTKWAHGFIDWFYKYTKFKWADIVAKAKGKEYLTSKGKMDVDTKIAHTRYIIDQVLSRWAAAKNHKEPQLKDSLSKTLQDELVYIFSGIDDDQVAQVIRNLARKIKDAPEDKPEEILSRANDWAELMNPIFTRISKSDPETFERLKALTGELKKHAKVK